MPPESNLFSEILFSYRGALEWLTVAIACIILLSSIDANATRLERHDLHAEHTLVEGQRPLEVGDVEHGVVEPDGGDCHEGPLPGRGRDVVTTQAMGTTFLTRQ